MSRRCPGDCTFDLCYCTVHVAIAPKYTAWLLEALHVHVFIFSIVAMPSNYQSYRKHHIVGSKLDWVLGGLHSPCRRLGTLASDMVLPPTAGMLPVQPRAHGRVNPLVPPLTVAAAAAKTAVAAEAAVPAAAARLPAVAAEADSA